MLYAVQINTETVRGFKDMIHVILIAMCHTAIRNAPLQKVLLHRPKFKRVLVLASFILGTNILYSLTPFTFIRVLSELVPEELVKN